MKLTLVAFAFVLNAGADVGSVQPYRPGGHFTLAFITPHHQPVSFTHSDRAIQLINIVDPNLKMSYPNLPYPYYFYPELSADKLFRMEEEINGKWFLSNPKNAAHSTASTSSFPVINSSAYAASTSSGIEAFGSAPNAIFQYPLLRLFHRVFNRSRPNRPQTIVTSGSSI